MTSPSTVLDVVRTGTRLVTAEDLAALFDVSRKTIQARTRRGELPTPLSTRPLKWSAPQIARFLEQGAET